MTDLLTREEVATAFAHADPALVRALPSIAPSADDLPLVLALASNARLPETVIAPLRALEDALVSVWQNLTPATAASYLTAL